MFSEAKTLMHPVEAMNHRKSGFFPTDVGTLENLFSDLTSSDKTVNLLDPCCGEGDALAQFKSHYPNAKTYGVELDLARAEVARSQLDYVYQADIYDVGLGRGQFDLLFLNPPYGNDLTDNLSSDKTERLEHKFLMQTFSALKADGVLIYIVPGKSLDEPRIKWLLARFKDLTIRQAAVDTYKQVVVMGTKLRQQRSVNAKMIESVVQQISGDNLLAETKPEYRLPSSKSKAKVIVKRLNEAAIAEVMRRYRGQWAYFDTLFTANVTNDFQRPIHKLSEWHLALLITSGAVQGRVSNTNGRELLVKGAVKKHKKVTQSATEDSDGNVTTEIESRDQFSAQIKAIDVTPKSPTFGNIITIK